MTDEPLQTTPLNALHHALGARMVPFAGYEMPVQYPAGVLKEHQHTRDAAGLFDVSHMGQVILRGRDVQTVALALETLVPVDVAGLAAGRQRYGFFTNDSGGIEDDLMIANRGDHLLLVVNAARKAADIALLKSALEPGITVEPVTDRALIALQGPAAGTVLAALCPEVAAMRFMDVASVTLQGVEAWVSRSGYTGEDGFEISVPEAAAEPVARALLASDRVAPIGLGARDSLRLEAGLCLYGHDATGATSPVEANLAWAIQKVRRRGGARAGGFPGADRILEELETGPERLRVGLLPEGRAPMREGVELYETEDADRPVGQVTSGGFGPTLGAPVSMAYLPVTLSKPGTRLFADIRGRRQAARVTVLPFTPSRFKR